MRAEGYIRVSRVGAQEGASLINSRWRQGIKGKRCRAENQRIAMVAEAEPVRAARDRVFTGVRSARAQVFLGSGLILFLELVLIRELGAKVVHLSYFTNFVLLGSFLGVGLGFLASGRRGSIARLSPALLAGLLALVTLLPVQIDRRSDQVIYFTRVEPSGPPTWVMLPIIFIAVAACVMGPAQLVGRSFRELPALDAYRADLLGSLAGIALFTGFAFLGAPPLVWGLVLVGLFVTLLGTARVVMFSCALLIALFVADLPSDRMTWSPYYRIVYEQLEFGGGQVGLNLNVNGVPHQVARGTEGRLRDDPLYGVPYERVAPGSLGRVLVVGAGTGNDVAVALSKGARVMRSRSTRKILDLGRRYHPDRPYDDPRVTTHVDDGRAFLERTDARFDLILFALPTPRAGDRRRCDTPRELPVHPRGDGDGTRALDGQRRLRHVQPLSRRLARRSLRGHGRVGVRARTMRRHGRTSRRPGSDLDRGR
jgi:hypothetical protein